MDLDSLPLQVEVMGWNPQTLADFMRKLKLTGCDKVVMKGNITGAQFMLMTELELQGFPTMLVPMITKIQSDIQSGEKRGQKTSFGMRLKASVFPKKVLVKDVWDSDEFDDGSDKDYDDTKQSESEYDGSSCDYEVPSSEYREQCGSESSAEETLPDRPPSPPPPRRKQSPAGRAVIPNVRPVLPRKGTAPPTPALPHFERSKKPCQPGPSKEDLSKPKEGSNVMYSGVASNPLPRPRTLRPKEASCNSSFKVRRAPAVPTETQKFAYLKSEPEQGLDPGWYGGKLTRRQAEVALHQINKDGAFVVRDSSRGSTEHPYTLMVFKEGKIYNIKITSNGESYSLGTTPKRSQRYPGVREMIAHHTHTPLHLIAATDRRSGATNQCCLLHPVGI